MTTGALGDFQRYPVPTMCISRPRCGRYVTLDIIVLAQRFRFRRSAPIDKVGPPLRYTTGGEMSGLSVDYFVGPATFAHRPSRG